jgi:hypothetical protein
MLLKQIVKKAETIIENKNKTVLENDIIRYCESQPIDPKYYVIDKTWIRDSQLPIHFSYSATTGIKNPPRLHFEPLRLHCERLRPSMAPHGSPQLLNFDFVTGSGSCF